MTPCATKGRRRLVPGPALILALTIGLVAGLTACGGDSPRSGAGTSVRPSATPKAGGTLTVSYLTDAQSLDPALAQNPTERSVANAVSQGLLRYTARPGAEGAVLEPCLADELPTRANGGISADGRTYSFALRRGVIFQPPLNRELTAGDVKYSLERMMGIAPAETRSLYAGVVGTARFLAGRDDEIDGLEVVDDETIRVRLTRPDPSFLNALAMESSYIVPEEWVVRWGAEFGQHPLGTGPFAFLRWVPGDKIKLARSPSYWEPGKPYVDAVDFVRAPTAETAVARLRAGEVDVLGHGLPPEGLPTFADEPSWQSQVRTRPLLAGTYLFLNTGLAPFDDVRVRRALSWAIDRERIAGLQPDRAEPLWQYYPPGLPGHAESAVSYGYAPAKAKSLLRQAGYPHGFETVLFTDREGLDPAILKTVRSNLAAVGISARLRTLDRAQYIRRRSKPGALAMGSIPWQADIPDPSDWIETMASKAGARRGDNPSFWWDARLETAQAAADTSADQQARIRQYTAMQRTIAAQAPYVPLYSSLQTTLCSKNTGGFYVHPVYRIDPASYWKM